MFKDNALGFLRIPSTIDAKLYLGPNYITALKDLRESE